MRLSKIILSSALVLSSLFAAAQSQEAKEEYIFNPHWYLQLQVGAQETLGETCFGDLLSPNAQIGLGYNFNPYIGARLNVNAWQSKGSFELNGVKNNYKWNYVAPAVNVTADLTNIFGGYNPNRVVGVGIFAGIGANIGFSNDEANTLRATLVAQNVDGLRKCWDGTKARFLGQFGANVDFKVSKRVSIGIELQANVLPDGYNSKKAGNADWYFNALAGVKIALGKTHDKVVIPAPAPIVVHDTVYVEKVVEKVVEVPVQVPQTNAAQVEPLRRDVFFTISKVTISKKEKAKVDEVIEYLKENPKAKVNVTGYADKGTGSMSLNLRLAKQRAEAVAKALRNAGISSDRIIVKSMGENDTEPYNDPIQNRVAICIAE